MPTGVYEHTKFQHTCTTCSVEFVNTSSKSILCKKCTKRRCDLDYREVNKIRIAAQQKQYAVRNKDKIKEDQAKYRIANKESLSLKAKELYAANPTHYKLKSENNRRANGVMPIKITETEIHVLDLLHKYFKYARVVLNCRDVLKSTTTGRYLELDFYMPDIKIAVELDGPIHREPIHGKERLERQIRNDAIKDKLCKDLGITLIRIPLEDGKHYDRPTGREALVSVVTKYIKEYKEQCVIE